MLRSEVLLKNEAWHNNGVLFTQIMTRLTVCECRQPGIFMLCEVSRFLMLLPEADEQQSNEKWKIQDVSSRWGCWVKASGAMKQNAFTTIRKPITSTFWGPPHCCVGVEHPSPYFYLSEDIIHITITLSLSTSLSPSINPLFLWCVRVLPCILHPIQNVVAITNQINPLSPAHSCAAWSWVKYKTWLIPV